MASNTKICDYCSIQDAKRIMTNLTCKATGGEMEAMLGEDEYNSLDMAWDRFLSLKKPEQLVLIDNKFSLLKFVDRQVDHWRYMQCFLKHMKRTWYEPPAPKPKYLENEPMYCTCHEGVYEVEQAIVNKLDEESLEYDGMRVYCKWGDHCRVMCETHRIRFHNLCIWGINCTRMKHDEEHMRTHHTTAWQEFCDKKNKQKICDLTVEKSRFIKACEENRKEECLVYINSRLHCKWGDSCQVEDSKHKKMWHETNVVDKDYNPGTICPCHRVNCEHQTYDLCCEHEACVGAKYHKGICPHHDNQEDYDKYHVFQAREDVEVSVGTDDESADDKLFQHCD
jgi:hypothetical protein